MRLSVAAVMLACGSCVTAQTTVVNTPVQKPTVLPHAPTQRPLIRRATPPGTVPGGVKTVSVPPNTPVVTLQGVCKDRQAKTACETVITREDLDGFIAASAPGGSKMSRGIQAVQYARSLAFSTLAVQQGLAKDPTVA